MKDDHKEYRLGCDCREPLHFIQFDWDRWLDGSEDINAFYCAHRGDGLWGRLLTAMNFVFGRQDLIMGDIVVSKDSAKELAAFLNEVAG